MSATNGTTHYNLSQYVGTDKPSYLTDYNGDMNKIDTAINTAKTTADTASTAATNAQTTAETAQTTATTAVTNAATAQTSANNALTNIGTLSNLTTVNKDNLVNAVNENVSNIGNLNNLETTNKTSLVTAINEVKNAEKYFKLYNNASNERNASITLSDNYTNYDEIIVEVNMFESRQNIIVISDEITPGISYLSNFSSSAANRRFAINFSDNNKVNIDFDDSNAGYIKAVYGCYKKN